MRITDLFDIGGSQRTLRERKSAGQSLVEFTIMLPILLMLLSGLIEFGFLLNTYLDVIDAAREAARFAANDDPTLGSPSDLTPNFWNRAWRNSRGSLFTASDGRINWTPTDAFDCTDVEGDMVISAFSFFNNAVNKRYPVGDSDGASNCGNYQSKISTAQVNSLMDTTSVDNSGAVLVEIYYEYEMLLGLPWITAFVPDPVLLHAYTMMPNTFAEPYTICHHPPGMPPITISLDAADPSIPAHLAHGDFIGVCP
jgi:hypothetical protein